MAESLHRLARFYQVQQQTAKAPSLYQQALRSTVHDIESLPDILFWHLTMEEIQHEMNEDHPGLLEMHRLL